MKVKNTKKIFSLDEATIKKFDKLMLLSNAKTNSELLTWLINEAYSKLEDENDKETDILKSINEKLSLLITISNENNLMDYQTRDALNSLICFYEPDTDFKSADTKAAGSDPHRFFQSSYKNYKARIHKASLEKSAKKI